METLQCTIRGYQESDMALLPLLGLLTCFIGCTADQRNVKVVYRIFAKGNWQSVVKDQRTIIAFSGLYDRAHSINCFIVADNQKEIDTASALLSAWGAKYILQSSDVGDTSFERYTLLRIPSLLSPDETFLYIHSKGVTHRGDELVPIYYWRLFMEYFLIKEHEMCINMLDHDDLDTVGTNLADHISHHYSGTFFWASSNYFLSLPHEISADYNGPEFYLLQQHLNITRAYSLWQSHVNHYNEVYLPKEYADKPSSWWSNTISSGL